MDAYKDLLDFPGSEKRIPCPLCSKDSEKTVIGEHWKCSGGCDHLFNQDNSLLPEGVECHCSLCSDKLNDLLEGKKHAKKKFKKKSKR